MQAEVAASLCCSLLRSSRRSSLTARMPSSGVSHEKLKRFLCAEEGNPHLAQPIAAPISRSGEGSARRHRATGSNARLSRHKEMMNTADAWVICTAIVCVKELVDIGAITRQAPGKYDLDVVRRETFAHLRAERGGHGTAALSTERAALAKEQTAAVSLKNAAARGDLISLVVIQKIVIAMFVVLRERLLTIPGKISDGLAMRLREEIEPILRDEINEALDELHDPTAFRGGKGSDRSPDVAGTQAPPQAPPAPIGRRNLLPRGENHPNARSLEKIIAN